jgi:hypothetical protein
MNFLSSHLSHHTYKRSIIPSPAFEMHNHLEFIKKKIYKFMWHEVFAHIFHITI